MGPLNLKHDICSPSHLFSMQPLCLSPVHLLELSICLGNWNSLFAEIELCIFGGSLNATCSIATPMCRRTNVFMKSFGVISTEKIALFPVNSWQQLKSVVHQPSDVLEVYYPRESVSVFLVRCWLVPFFVFILY